MIEWQWRRFRWYGRERIVKRHGQVNLQKRLNAFAVRSAAEPTAKNFWSSCGELPSLEGAKMYFSANMFPESERTILFSGRGTLLSDKMTVDGLQHFAGCWLNLEFWNLQNIECSAHHCRLNHQMSCYLQNSASIWLRVHHPERRGSQFRSAFTHVQLCFLVGCLRHQNCLTIT